MSKGEFAASIGITPGRLSQYFTAGIVDEAALEGAGRNAKVKVAVATEQIKRRRHIGQSLGNGIGTRLDLAAPPLSPAIEQPQSGPGIAPRSDDVAHLIQQERLESERRKNRLASQDEAVQQGRLVSADHVRVEMTKLARQVDDENAAMLADFASALASEFQIPQRDALHLLRKVRAEKRAAAAQRARIRAGDIPKTVDVMVEEVAVS